VIAKEGLEPIYRELAALRRALGEQLPPELRSLYACVMLELSGEDCPDGLKPRTYALQQLRERAHHQGDNLLRDRCDVQFRGAPHFRSLESSRYYNVPHRRVTVRGLSPVIVRQLSDGRLLCRIRSQEPTCGYWILLHEDGSFDRELYHLGHDLYLRLCRRDDRLVFYRDDGTLWAASVDHDEMVHMAGEQHIRTDVSELSDGRMVTYGWSPYVCFWSAEGELLSKLDVLAPRPSALFWVDDLRLWTGDETGVLRLWSSDGVLLRTVQAHDARITRIRALSGNRLVSWDEQGIMKLWSQEGDWIANCMGRHHKSLEILAVDDEHWISYPAHESGVPFLWNSTGQCLGTFGVREGETLDFPYFDKLPDGTIAAKINDHCLRWLRPDGTILHEIENQASLDMSIPIGERLLTFGWGAWCRLWTADAKPAAELRTGHREVLRVLRNHSVVICDPHFRLWDLEHAEHRQWIGHDGAVEYICEDEQGRVYTYGTDGALRIWQADGRLDRVHATDMHGRAVPLSTERFMIMRTGILRTYSDKAFLCDVAKSPHLVQFALPTQRPVSTTVHVLDSGRFILSTHGKTFVYDKDGRLLSTLNYQATGSVHLTDQFALLYGYDGGLQIYGDDLVRVIDEGQTYTGATLLSNGHILAWSWRVLRLWALDGTLIADLRGHTRAMGGAVEVGGERIVSWSPVPVNYSGSDDPQVMPVQDLGLWDTDGTLITELRGQQMVTRRVSPLPNGGWVSWGDRENQREILWWSADGQLVNRRQDYGKPFGGALVLDDHRLLTWSDTTLWLWAQDGTLLAAHRLHDTITACHLHSSGMLVVGDQIGRVQFLEVVNNEQ
jgi:hypothetical protein